MNARPARGLPAAARLRRALDLLLRGWDRFSLYLPIILMGAVALGSYWLVRLAPQLTRPAAQQAPRHEPDFFMRGFTLRTFLPSGQLRSEVSGQEGRHYLDTDTLEIDAVRVHALSPQGLVSQARAERGLSNGDGSEIQLMGNAVVVREAGPLADGRVAPRLEFRGEFLHAFVRTEQVRSHLPVTLIRGADRITADTLAYDNLNGVAVLEGRVRAVLMPPGAAALRP